MQNTVNSKTSLLIENTFIILFMIKFPFSLRLSFQSKLCVIGAEMTMSDVFFIGQNSHIELSIGIYKYLVLSLLNDGI